jgi:DNA-binding transcriptional LysR family regulator
MFELKQLRCFVAVASEMNFHRAAKRLHMTQPPLSRQIQILEQEIGVQLIDRSGRSIRLTAAGNRFFVEAQDLLRRAEEAALSTRAAASGLEGSVTLGFVPISTLNLLPRIMPSLEARMPDVRIMLREMLTLQQIEALNSGRHDLGILRAPRKRGAVPIRRLLREDYYLAMHESHPFCERSALILSDLNDQNLLMYSPSEGWYGYDIFNSIFTTHDVRPRFVQYFGETLTMLSLVNVGSGLALVSESAQQLGFSAVRFKPISLPKEAVSEYFLAYSPSRISDPAVRSVYDTILELCDA